MVSSIVPVADLYKLNTQFFITALDGIGENDVFLRPGGRANSIGFIASHMASSRFVTLSLLGGEGENPWGDLYDMGAVIKDKSAYPGLKDIRATWFRVSDMILKCLDIVTEEELMKESKSEISGHESTVRGALAFLAFHEGYHLGQLAYFRRLHGYDRVFG